MAVPESQNSRSVSNASRAMTSGSNVDADISRVSNDHPNRDSRRVLEDPPTTSTARPEEAFSAHASSNSRRPLPRSAPCTDTRVTENTGAPSGVLDVVDGDDDASFAYTRNVPLRHDVDVARASKTLSPVSSLDVLARRRARGIIHRFRARVLVSDVRVARSRRASFEPRVDRGRFEVEMDAHGAFVHAGLGARAFNATSTSCVASASASASTRGVMCGARTSCFISIHFNRFVTSPRRLARCRRRKRLDARFERDDVTRRHDGDSRSRRRDDGARR